MGQGQADKGGEVCRGLKPRVLPEQGKSVKGVKGQWNWGPGWRKGKQRLLLEGTAGGSWGSGRTLLPGRKLWGKEPCCGDGGLRVESRGEFRSSHSP